ncbi:putative NADH-flavin reductase [Shewanella psychrophila]|uniref:Putative NADH-flavin reductase n=1 Tax=Shewanella psychrophila TaxID=225848 RepID=A0A1S6HVQ5_9GAMM|nr:NAD(P)H-binding protein [Shewanella psychrophila]AQS39645.1 putative NADH-flavin reductase [Shewanella psychrophila]
MKYKNLLILGASGAIGLWLVKMALTRGYTLTVVVRSKVRFIQSLHDFIALKSEAVAAINIIEGDVMNAQVIAQAVEGQDAVLSSLGLRRKNQANPWSAVVSPKDLTERVAKLLVPTMEQAKVTRLIVVSSAGVGDSWKDISGFMKFMVGSSKIKVTYDDLDKMESLLARSDIDSLSLRPVGLVEAEPSQDAQIVERFTASSQISKSDVAQWMLDALKREERFTSPTEMIGWAK